MKSQSQIFILVRAWGLGGGVIKGKERERERGGGRERNVRDSEILERVRNSTEHVFIPCQFTVRFAVLVNPF